MSGGSGGNTGSRNCHGSGMMGEIFLFASGPPFRHGSREREFLLLFQNLWNKKMQPWLLGPQTSAISIKVSSIWSDTNGRKSDCPTVRLPFSSIWSTFSNFYFPMVDEIKEWDRRLLGDVVAKPINIKITKHQEKDSVKWFCMLKTKVKDNNQPVGDHGQ